MVAFSDFMLAYDVIRVLDMTTIWNIIYCVICVQMVLVAILDE